MSLYPMDRLNGREARLLRQNMSFGERVIAQCVGSWGQAAIATDRKVLIIKCGWLAGAFLGGKVTTFFYPNITGVEVRVGILTGVFQIVAAGQSGNERQFFGKDRDDAFKAPNCVPFDRSQQAQFNRLAALIRELSAGRNVDAPPAFPGIESLAEIEKARLLPPEQLATAASNDFASTIEKIRQLAELRDAGIISELEFETKKNELLDRL
jgi:hypothetical protein